MKSKVDFIRVTERVSRPREPDWTYAPRILATRVIDTVEPFDFLGDGTIKSRITYSKNMYVHVAETVEEIFAMLKEAP